MMKISAKAEYACVAMLELAAHYGLAQPTRIKAIARAHGIPSRFLVQILLQLKGAGLVSSTRGVAGGYLLARSPETISLADIVNIIDRPESIRLDQPPASSPAVRAVRSVWQSLQAQEQERLAEISLASLVRESLTANEFVYHI